MSEAALWFRSQPWVTKWLLVASAVLPLAMKLRLLSPAWLVFHWPSIYGRLQAKTPLQ